MIPVLVTDGEQRSSLAIVRSLGRAGYAPYVCSARQRSLAGASRFARAEATVPDPLRDADGFVGALERLIDRWRIEVLLPVTEPALLAVLPARDRLRGVRIPLPDLETFRAISDKRRLLEAADRAGIAVPRQWVVPGPGALEDVTAQSLAYPLVLKPSRSVGESGGGRIKLGVGYAADPAELAERLAALPAAAYPVLLQQRIVGPGAGIFLLVRDGRTLARFAHRRLREKPPSGGVSVYSESIAPDPVLFERSAALLEHFGWSGPAMVEYKMDAATGTAYLMEVNARFWGSLQLAIDAGVDFPALLVAAALGEPCQPVGEYRVGVRLRWWWGDVDHLVTRLRRRPTALALPPGAPGRWAVIRDFIRFGRPGERPETFRFGDPMPFFRESLDWIRRR